MKTFTLQLKIGYRNMIENLKKHIFVKGII